MSATLAIQHPSLPSYGTGANLCRSHLQGAHLRGADLRQAWLTAARLEGADLRDARLGGADLTDSRLAGADLRGADLREAALTGADLRGADLRGAELLGANLADARWDGRTRWPEPFRTAHHPELIRVDAPARAARPAAGSAVSFAPLWLAGLGVLAADQWIKDAARVAFAAGREAVPVVPGALSLTYAQNHGTLLGSFPASGPLLLAATLAVVLGVAIWLLAAMRAGRASSASVAGAVMVLAGERHRLQLRRPGHPGRPAPAQPRRRRSRAAPAPDGLSVTFTFNI
jgi:hypothetical protein